MPDLELAALDQAIAGWDVPASLGVTSSVPPLPLEPAPPAVAPSSCGCTVPLGGIVLTIALGGLLGVLLGRAVRR